MRRRRTLLPSAVALAVAALAAFAAGPPPAGAATAATAVTPAAATAKPWMNAADTPAQRADTLLAQMTTAEKITMMHGGAQCPWGACVDADTRLGIPQLRLQDGPAGVADGAGGVTQLPAPVAAAATWDRDLAKSYGQVIGNEAWGKGANVVLGPTINIDRDPRWGRSFESLSEDPYLAGELGAADIQGIQSQGPMAQVKHYADYNQETNRNNVQDNVIMSDRTQREIYLPAFEAAVGQGKAYSVMCSYATVAGTYACENARLIQQVLEGDLGFSGFVTSDWGGTHSTVAAANAGLDQEMNGSDFYGQALTDAVNSGQVSTATLDGHVRRILTSMFASGLFDTPQTGTITTAVGTDAHRTTARQVAEEGSVLLKNAGNALPLGAGNKKIAVIGDDAGANAMSAGGGSAHVGSSTVVTPFGALAARAGSAASVTYSQGYSSPGGEIVDSPYLTPSQGGGHGLYGQFYDGTSLGGSPVASGVDPTINFLWGGASPKSPVPATSWSAKWTGTLTPPSTGGYTFSLSSDDGSRLFVNGQQIIANWADQPRTTKTGTVSLTAGQPVSIEVDYFQDGGGSELELGWQVPDQDLHGQAVAAARSADTAIVFVDKGEGEGADLGDIDLPGDQNQLVADVAAANPDTVVVVNSGSAITMPWAGSVRGIVENWYPGQEDGNAVAALLYGDVNFSGKLPVTFPQSLADVPAHTTAQWPGQNNQVQYSEGVDVGYRWYDAQGRTPLYPFGFGLSYTTFSFGNLTVGQPDGGGNVAVGFDVKNTGSRAGADVAQVYVGEPAATGEPPKSLRGFQRVSLNAGQTQHVTLTLGARSFQYWNNGWTNAAGANTVSVGDSSRSTPLSSTTTIPAGGGGTPPSQGTPISLRAHADNQYVTAENAGAAPLIANRAAIGPWETFDEIDLGGGQIALRAHANGTYVTSPGGGSGSLIASATSIGQAETFDLIHDPDGAVTLRAHSDSQYVTAENAGTAPLVANRTAIGPWEEFDLIDD
jgi:beta-glucosidase